MCCDKCKTKIHHSQRMKPRWREENRGGKENLLFFERKFGHYKKLPYFCTRKRGTTHKFTRRGSSAGYSAGFIILRSRVQSPASLLQEGSILTNRSFFFSASSPCFVSSAVAAPAFHPRQHATLGATDSPRARCLHNARLSDTHTEWLLSSPRERARIFPTRTKKHPLFFPFLP